MKMLISLLRNSKTILITLVVGAAIAWAGNFVANSDNETLKKIVSIFIDKEEDIKKVLDDSLTDALEDLEDGS